MDFSQYVQYVDDSANERAARYQALLDKARQQSVQAEPVPSSSGSNPNSFNGEALETIQNLQNQQNVQNLKDGNKIPLNWSTWYYGGFPNAYQNLKDIGTGVVSMASHPIANAIRFGKYELKNVKNTFNEGRILGEMLKDGNASLGDVVNQIGMMGYVNPLTATVRDAADLWGKSYGVSTKTPTEFVKAGKQGGLQGVVNKGTQQVYDTANAMFQNPVDVALDAVGLGGGKILKGALSKTAIGKNLKAGETVEKGLNVKTAGVQKDINKLNDQLQVIKKDKNVDLEDLVRRAEETGDWTNVPVQQKQLLKNFSDDYHTIAQKHSPSTAVDPEHMAISQNIARKNNITYREAEKQIQALKDSVPEGTPVVTIRSIQELGDVAKTNELVNNLRKEANLNEVLTPKVTYTNEAKELIKSVPEDSILSKEMNYAGQSQKVKDALDKIAPELITPEKTGLNIYNDLVVKTGSPQAASDLLRKAGIGGMRGVEDSVTTIFGGKAKGGYNLKTDSISFFKDADNVTRAHELFHRSLEQTSSVPKVKAALEKGLGKDYKLTRDVMENLADEFLDYAQTGKLVRPELQDLFDIYLKDVQKGSGKLQGITELANQGDKLAQDYVNAVEMYKRGDIFPITHALAEAVDLKKLGGRVDDLDRIYAGKFSTREYGLTPYAEVAKSLKRPSEFLDGLSQQYVGRSIKDELQGGTLNGKSVASAIEKDNVYVPKSLLEGTDTFQKIQEKASAKPINVDDIAINKRVLKELSNQTKQVGKFFAQDWANDLYAIAKSSMLASGTYLGANVIGGGINAIMSSGLHTLDDFARAIKTQGQLSKNLGTYRNVSSLKDVKTPWLKPIQTVNKYTTGAITEWLDRKTQNIFSEMAAHRQLRQKGILPKDRLNALDELDASSLGDVIEGIKAEALLNSTRTTLPRLAVEIGSAQNPFWRWNDTAARSTMYMLEHHPITSNVILNRVLADIGFDDEIQNRLNLGVKSDKPFVTYRFDERTGQIKEGSLEWIPQMNTFKLIGTGLDMQEGFFKNPTQAPVFIKIANAFQGKDQYGRALKRAERDPSGRLRHLYDGAKRYYISDNGIVEQGTSADEIVSTFAKETIGILNAANKTGLPVAGTLTGNKFYQPYGQSMFGSFGRDELNSNIISGGDPRKPRELADVMSSLLGYYEQPYIPRFESNVPQFTKSSFGGLVRGQRYDLMKKMRGY